MGSIQLMRGNVISHLATPDSNDFFLIAASRVGLVFNIVFGRKPRQKLKTNERQTSWLIHWTLDASLQRTEISLSSPDNLPDALSPGR